MSETRHVTENDHPGLLVKAAREALGLTQDKLAERSGMPRTHIANIERGQNKAGGREARKGLATGFGVLSDEIDDLLEGRMTVDQFVALVRSGPLGATVGRQRTVAYDDPYPNREAAIALVQQAVADARRISNAEGDRPIEWWVERISKLVSVRADTERAIHQIVASDIFDLKPDVPAGPNAAKKKGRS